MKKALALLVIGIVFGIGQSALGADKYLCQVLEGTADVEFSKIRELVKKELPVTLRESGISDSEILATVDSIVKASDDSLLFSLMDASIENEFCVTDNDTESSTVDSSKVAKVRSK